MGKPTGFMIYDRKTGEAQAPEERLKNFREFHIPLSKEEQQLQGARCMECGIPFCQSGMILGGMTSGCPLRNLIPEWNDLLYTGNWEEAYKRLMKTNNFPEFTGRVCPAPCEASCTCGLDGDPVSIKGNELSIIENAFKEGYAIARVPKIRTGKKIAIVGSGPSGLSAADQLNKRGHWVTVFERSDRPGGLLMYGIPNMKLDKQVIERRISLLKEEGIEFILNADVGKRIKPDQLLKDYDRVVLACGASKPRDIEVPGRGAGGICFAVDFLTSATKYLLDGAFKGQDGLTARNKKVLVIGGGDTGNDCVGTSMRMGAASVVQLEIMPRLPDSRAEDNPWPQWPKVCKTDYGQEEAASVFGKDPRIYQATVREFLADEAGNVKQARLVRLKQARDVKTGRLSMTEVPGSGQLIDVDLVLIAAGFLGSEDYVTRGFPVEVDQRSNVSAKAGGYLTSKRNVFVAGDMHRGQSLVVWAIREGREAAREVDLSLMGYTNLSV